MKFTHRFYFGARVGRARPFGAPFVPQGKQGKRAVPLRDVCPLLVLKWTSLLSLLLLVPALVKAQAAPDAGWPNYGSDPGGTRYSPARQIDRGNVAQLKVAWTYRTGALPYDEELDKKAAFEATPILVDGKLFLSTPYDHVIALNAVSGAKIWEFDPKLEHPYGFSEVTSRGVSAWRDDSAKARKGGVCALRIFIGTLDARLIALDGETGKSCVDFGTNGEIDLTTEVKIRDPGDYQVTSAPAIFKDLVITGSSEGDNRAVTLERGIVRAFDVRTGSPPWPLCRSPHWCSPRSQSQVSSRTPQARSCLA